MCNASKYSMRKLITFKNTIDIFQVVLLIIGTKVAFMGYEAASKALNFYETANTLSRKTQLENTDRQIVMLGFEHPFLDSIWAVPPDNLQGKARADYQLEAIWDINGQSNDTVPEWKNMSDLESMLYSPGTYGNDKYIQLRNSYTALEMILYLISDAYEARMSDHLNITQNHAETYYAYINDIGDHPLFLEALWFGHKGGYITENFAIFIKEQLLKDLDRKNNISEIYSDLLKTEWVSKIGHNGTWNP